MDQHDAVPDPLEYVTCVFYLRSPPHWRTLAGRLLCTLGGLRLPRVELYAGREYAAEPPGPASGWPRDKESLTCAGVDVATPEGRRLLDELPCDTGTVLLSAVRRGAKHKAVDLVWDAWLFSGAAGELANPRDWSPELCRLSDPCVVLSFRTSHLDRLEAAALREAIDALVAAVVAHTDCYYGFVHCEDGEETNDASLCTPMTIEPYGRHVLLADAVWWHQETDRRTHVRGIYWGNLFGPALAERFLAQRDLLREFVGWTTTNPVGRPVSPAQYGRRFENGSWIRRIPS